MKKIFATLLAFSMIGFVFCQDSLNDYQKPLVRVLNWTNKTMMITEEGWENIKKEIIPIIGEAKVNDIMRHYDWKSIPSRMSIFDGVRLTPMPEISARLDSLKGIRKVVSFKYYFRDKYYGDRVILEVSYNGNEQWDTGTKWDVVYFILNEEDVEIVKETKK